MISKEAIKEVREVMEHRAEESRQAKQTKDITYVIDAMKLLIEWKRLSDQCLTRDTCKECPYHINFTCSKQSTIDILTTAANVFDDFLQEQE